MDIIQIKSITRGLTFYIRNAKYFYHLRLGTHADRFEFGTLPEPRRLSALTSPAAHTLPISHVDQLCMSYLHIPSCVSSSSSLHFAFPHSVAPTIPSLAFAQYNNLLDLSVCTSYLHKIYIPLYYLAWIQLDMAHVHRLSIPILDDIHICSSLSKISAHHQTANLRTFNIAPFSPDICKPLSLHSTAVQF